ncbi:hypothetical protein UCD39_24450 [Nitrospirillum sp. BR 11752]|uniref:DUF6968 family protein n=1 Tax=Nitrospirillum sp. BR 11752 TaxID=3104293 RepID=UPI002EADFBE4|nr:hypothetical protein [Nitrospirillum sp. BR 11752]
MDEMPFVERVFELEGRGLAVRFYRPELGPEGDFSCRWVIDWPDGPAGGVIFGLDGIQALMLSMRHARAHLIESDAYRGED